MRGRLARLLVCGLLVPAMAVAEDWREISATYTVEAGQAVRLELSVGEFKIEGTSGDKIEVEARIECRWSGDEECQRMLDKVRFEDSSSSRRRTVELVSESSWRKTKLEIEGTFRVPRGAALEVDMGVGEIEIEGIEADLNLDLGVGEVEVRIDAARVATVSLDVGVGEAELMGSGSRVEGRRSLLVGSEVYWSEGEGAAKIKVDVGVGEITVWLQ